MPATQQNRFLAIETTLGADVLVIRRISVREQIGRLFQFEVELASEKNDIDLDALVGSNATIRLTLPNAKSRFFNGYISRFALSGNEGAYVIYQATLVP